jgi:hypothetical protein
VRGTKKVKIHVDVLELLNDHKNVEIV